MKKVQNLFLSLLFLSIFAGCSDDFLEKQPLNILSDDAVWGDVNLAEAFLNEIYLGLPNGFARGYYMLASATDEADNSYSWTQIELIALGTATAGSFCQFGVPWESQHAQGPWGLNYNYIRRANIFLERVVEVPEPNEIVKKKKDRITGEAKFLRSLFYHELTRLYGGVPLITQALGADNIDALLTPRNTYDECVDFMVRELDEAIALLPDEAYKGRPVKSSAQALKGRVLMYAKKWATSAAASKAVIDGGKHSLYNNYAGLFLAENQLSNPEIIFGNEFGIETREHEVDKFNNPSGNPGGGWGGTCPTQNLVDKYEMTDGLPYDKSPLYNANNPYENREPRFYASIQHDGVTWGGVTVETRVKGRAGIDGGPNGTNADATKTGYYMRKFLDEKNVGRLYAPLGGSYNTWIIIRYAEVLLNYAEAQNEAVGPDGSVYDAVNLVRARVKLPPLEGGLSQEQMREKIRQERAVELAFEEHRFYDVRRWGLGKELFNDTPIYGMRISQDGTKFDRFELERRVFQPGRDELQPIPQSEIDKNSKLVQNPGW